MADTNKLTANVALIEQRHFPKSECHVFLSQEVPRFSSWYVGSRIFAVLPNQQAALEWITENVDVKTWNGRPRIETFWQSC